MENETDIQQKIEARLAELPQDVRDAINASDLDEKVRAIGEKFSLHIDQMGILGDEVMLAMLGFTPLGGFAGELAAQLHIAPAMADTLAAEINSDIFVSIRESMKQFTEARAAGAPAPAPATPAAPVAIGPTTIVVAKPAAVPLSPDMHAAEAMLSKTVVQVAPPAAVSDSAAHVPLKEATPMTYQADPYREPIE